MKVRQPHELFYEWDSATPNGEVWRIDWKRWGLDYCGVYIITPDNRWPCKVGLSVNPIKRLNQLQTSVWVPLTMGEYRWCSNSADARTIERATHKILREQGRELYGEWFDIRAPEAAEAMDWAALEMGINLGRGVPRGRNDIREHLERLITDWSIRRSHARSQMEADSNVTVISVTGDNPIRL